MKKHNSASGFTLIELSIVLVIIGLIVGGILVGRDLIHAAELRTVISDREKLITATHTFQGKYNCIPGDCKRATNFFPDATNGDGDGKINSRFWPVGGSGDIAEALMYYFELSEAQLITGSYTGVNSGSGAGYAIGVNIMASRYSPTIGYTVAMYPAIADSGVDFSTDILTHYNGNMIFIGGVSSYESYDPAFAPSDAYYIDHKIDDDLPGSGNLIAFIPMAYSGGDLCVTDPDPAVATYNLTKNNISCGLMSRAGF